MDNLFFAFWKNPGQRVRRSEDFWLDPPASGFGRMVAAVVVIGIAACLLDHAAAVRSKADSVAVASYASPQEGNEK